MRHEEWRDIEGYEGLYQVSNLGNVRSLERLVWNGKVYFRKKEMLLKLNVMRVGYGRVTLTKDAKQEQRYVHRLVAETFIPNPSNLKEVDHIDANRLNNNVENLRWVTHLTNIQHCVELGRHYDGSANLVHGAYKRPIRRSDGTLYESVVSAARDLGYKTCTMVRDVLIGKRAECRGYSFKYVE